MKNVILIIDAEGRIEAFSNLLKACEAKAWPYNTLGKKDISEPFEYKGVKVLRIKVK